MNDHLKLLTGMSTHSIRTIEQYSGFKKAKYSMQSIRSLILFFVLSIFALVFLPLSKSFERSVFITLQFMLIGLISIIQMSLENKKHLISLNLIHWLFIYAFMFCAGTVQFANDTFLWDFAPTLSEIKTANFLILLWCIVFTIIHYFVHPTSFSFRNKENKHLYTQYSALFHVTLNFVLFILALITIITVDFKSFFVRSIYEVSSLNNIFGSSSLSHLVLSLIRGFSLWNAMISIKNLKNKKNASCVILLIVSLFCSLVLVPPLGVARYVFACYYGGLAVYGISSFRKGNLFLYLLFFGLLVVFPLLNAFRGTQTLDITSRVLVENMGTIRGNFATADYDSYTMLVYTVRYCHSINITYGRQLVGTLLFFVPRDVWTNKPEGSGSLVINSLAHTNVNSNVSCPLLAEGYINFGIVGLFAFGAILAIVIKKIDSAMYNRWKNGFTTDAMFYSFIVLFSLFMFRGDLLSSFSTLIGYAVSFIALRFVVYRLSKGIKND